MVPEDEALPEGVRRKLVESKQRWAREGRLLTGQDPGQAPGQAPGRIPAGEGSRPRLPPGQRRVADFPVLDLGLQPAVTREAFRLKVEGLVERPVTLDWAWLQELPQEERVNDIHCVTQWSRYDNRWSGVPAPALLDLVRLKPGAAFVSFEAHDGYTTNLRLDDFARPENLLAHSWEGRPLTRQHGGPLRIVVPHLYLWKSAKWVRRITFTNRNQPGFWEVRGYHDRGDPWLEERYG